MAKGDTIVLRSLKAVEDIAGGAEQEMARVMSKLEKLLIERVTEITAERRVDIALATAQVQQTLVDAGYYEEVSRLLNEDYQKAIDISFEAYKAKFGEAFRFSAESLDELNAFKRVDLTEFNRLGTKMAEELSRGIVDLQFRTVTRRQLFDTIFPKIIATNQRYVNTWINTGLAGFYNEANVALAEDAGFKRFRYAGVINPNTRPFCQKHINEVKTIPQWNKLNEEQGQIAPVSRFAGGFNCIHTLVAVA